jgi:glutathione S-transferase
LLLLLPKIRYLCDKYDTAHRLLPAPGDPHRYKVLQWVHASEATFALHGISVLYIRLHQKTGDVEATEKGASVNIGKDLDYLEDVLAKSSGKFIFGDEVTAADVMMHFSAVFILQRQLVPKGREGDWPGVRRWIQDCEATESYKEAVKKTGHKI